MEHRSQGVASQVVSTEGMQGVEQQLESDPELEVLCICGAETGETIERREKNKAAAIESQ